MSKYRFQNTQKNDRTNMKTDRARMLSERGRAAKIRNVVAVNWRLNKKEFSSRSWLVGPITVFSRDLPKIGFHNHFVRWFQTVVSLSILDGLA